MTSKQRLQQYFFAALSLLLLSPAMARAQVWTHAASSCTVDEDSTSKHEFSASRLRFKGTNTGTITARCNVVNLNGSQNPTWNLLEVVYQDPDGNSTNSQAVVVLWRASNSTGGVFELARFTSDPFGVNNNNGPQSVGFNHSFNFMSYAYFVTIEVKRSSSASSPDVSLVRLTHQGPF